MTDAIIYLATSFWIGAVHAATPGHGKTIAAAYIVGARDKPVDAVILGVFVTLSHTSGIVLVGVLASLGLPGMVPQRIEAWMALITGILVIGIGVWTLWTQRELILQLQGVAPAPWNAHYHSQEHAGMRFRPHAHEGEHTHGHLQHGHAHAHGHEHSHNHDHAHDHTHPHHDAEAGSHSHGWGFKHTHDLKLATTNRPSLWVLIGLGIAGGLLPDPAALASCSPAGSGQGDAGAGHGAGVQPGLCRHAGGRGCDCREGRAEDPHLAGGAVGRANQICRAGGVILSFKAWTTLSTLA
jgi:nickel/cobalt exporter